LGLLQSLLKETTVFAAGAETAEAHPKATIQLARTSTELVAEAMGQPVYWILPLT